MRLYLNGHDRRYAAEQIMLTMFPAEKPECVETPFEGDGAEISLRRGKKLLVSRCALRLNGKVFEGRAAARLPDPPDDFERVRLENRVVKLSFYRAALRSGVPAPAWGSLTGVRPAKLVSSYLAAGLSPAAAVSRLTREYGCTSKRARLCLDAAQVSREVTESLGARDICLYVGIPFCPTRCAYCSFVSNSVEKSGKLIEPFLEALYRDIDATAETAKRLGLRPVSLYIGGGTPTTLTAPQLDALLSRLKSAFDLSSLREYTVEAGRPDTVTLEKLLTLKKHGVCRVSVNPQTMSDPVLEAIGRRHTARDILDALSLVREAGGFAVNMDLIAGLPTDTPEGFSDTLSQVLSLAPENITVHTLSLKKGSRITLEGTPLPSAADVALMLDEAGERLAAAGYSPYYLYRQKFTSGGFENVGWTKKGHVNLYNVCIMEELCTILAMGGGASTKLISPAGRIERVFAPKYPLEYIGGVDSVEAGKNRIEEFYNAVSTD